MTDLESSIPSTDTPAAEAASLPTKEAAKTITTHHPVHTGLAGLLVGGLLLGKKGGLLAGLVGVGARMLLEKERGSGPPVSDPAAAEPTTTVVSETPLAPEKLEPTETPLQEMEALPLPANPELGTSDDEPPEETSTSSEIVVNTPEEEPVVAEAAIVVPESPDDSIIPAEVSPPNSEPESPPTPVQLQETSPLEIGEPTPLAPVISNPVKDEQSELEPEAQEIPGTSSPTLLPESKFGFNDPLDEALENSEGFRNLGETWRQPTSSPVEIPPPATLPASSPSGLQMESSAFLAMPEADLAPAPNFVQWPQSVTASEPSVAPSDDPVFENYLASMFKEAAEDLAPASAPLPIQVQAPEPKVAPNPAPVPASARVDDLEAFPSLPNLTPEDIWRLAAEAPDTLNATPSPATSATALPAVKELPPAVIASDSLVKMLGISPEGFSHQPVPPAAKADKPALRVEDPTAREFPDLQPIEAPLLSPFAAPYQPPLGSVPPLSFPPRTIQLVDRGAQTKKRRFRYDRIANLLVVLALIYVGYVFRVPLMNRWSGAGSDVEPSLSLPKATPPAPPVSVVIKPPLEEIPPPPTPAITLEPPTDPPPASPTPEPPATPPDAPKIEVRPAANLPELPAEPDSSPAPPNAQASPEDAARREAEGAVKKFLASTKVGELLPLILNSEKLGPTVRKYYVSEAVPPTPFDNIVMDSGARVPETNTRAFLFRVRSPVRPQGFPVCTEETPQGFKIEWEAFVQCRDRTLATFWKTADAPPTRLFVVLKRSHYFEEDVPNLEDYDCFSISSPNPDEDPVYSFAKKNSAFTQKFRTRLSWEANYFIVATFAHVKASNGSTHVEIEEIERFSWRNLGN